MRCGEINLMMETENYSAAINSGKPVAVFKTRKNVDGTFSNYVEMFNCSDEQVAFIPKCNRNQTDGWSFCIRKIPHICCGTAESLQTLKKRNEN